MPSTISLEDHVKLQKDAPAESLKERKARERMKARQRDEQFEKEMYDSIMQAMQLAEPGNKLARPCEKKAEPVSVAEEAGIEVNVENVIEQTGSPLEISKRDLLMSNSNVNENLKSLLCQLTDEEIEKLDLVDDVLGKFFAEKDFPEFFLSKLRGPKFTQATNPSGTSKTTFDYNPINSKAELEEQERWEEFQKNYRKLLTEVRQERELRETAEGMIKAENIVKRRNLAGRRRDSIQALDVLEQDADSLNTWQKLHLLKNQLWAVRYFMDKAHGEDTDESSPEVAAPAAAKTIIHAKPKPPIVIKRKFRVDIDMLERRERMSERVVLERRYNIIKAVSYTHLTLPTICSV
eukprot:TRINITY_DN12904_c0_g1_i1.p1 TRINITY_DN12904_c0_g1~~TRINITY_DN12904_c0_g1_i1.p1  ORF type:complete len:350 (+),score=96.53 TRINITY_DN12904_c0_g1_i1:832-1881(+)